MPSRLAQARAARTALWAHALVAAAGASGCREYACNGEAFVKRPSTPVIEHIDVVQPLAPPLPANPWLLSLNVRFSDPGADLGGGTAFVHLYGSPLVSRSFALDSYFRASEVPLDATSGTFALYMQIPQGTFQDADHVQMDVQLEDASQPDPKGLFSNCYRMNLDFAVVPLTTAALRLADWGSARLASARQAMP